MNRRTLVTQPLSSVSAALGSFRGSLLLARGKTVATLGGLQASVNLGLVQRSSEKELSLDLQER